MMGHIKDKTCKKKKFLNYSSIQKNKQMSSYKSNTSAIVEKEVKFFFSILINTSEWLKCLRIISLNQ